MRNRKEHSQLSSRRTPRKTDLEESTIDDVLEILRREYEDEDDNTHEESTADDNSEAKS